MVGGGICSLTDGNLVDRLQDKRQFIHQTFRILSDYAPAEEAKACMAEMSKFYDETRRKLYMSAGDREHD